jgi:hypothetical protein
MRIMIPHQIAHSDALQAAIFARRVRDMAAARAKDAAADLETAERELAIAVEKLEALNAKTQENA